MRVQPRASRDEILGEQGGALRVRVTSAPAEGAANEAVLRLLARAVGVPPSTIEIVKGAGSRDKLLAFHGLSAEVLRHYFAIS